eukprot:336273_1
MGTITTQISKIIDTQNTRKPSEMEIISQQISKIMAQQAQMHEQNTPLKEFIHVNIENCDHVAKDCQFVQDFTQTLLDLQNCEEQDLGQVNMTTLLTQFHHFMYAHNQSDEFELIYDSLGGECDTKTCIHLQQMRNAAQNQILNKIHCFLVHSFDIGARLSTADTEVILSDLCDDTQPSLFELKSTHVTANKLLAPRHKLYQDIRCSFENKNVNRFVAHYESEEEKKESHSNNVFGSDVYQFGYQFTYDGDRHDAEFYEESEIYIGYVKPLHKSLKDEVVQNKYCIIDISQFNNELKKAKLHLNTAYARKITSNHNLNLTAQHLLSAMLYCNFDAYSYEFSKSYRKVSKQESKKNVRNHHASFCHMGSLLDELVNAFEHPQNADTYYHGVDKKLNFSLAGHWNDVFIPMSTSSCYAIAISFAAANGVVVMLYNDFMEPGRYFQCNWISDYAAENECLFIQSGNVLRFSNIIDVAESCEYWRILGAISILSRFNIFDNIDETGSQIITCLLQNELNIKKFLSLSLYGSHLFHQFCCNKQGLELNIDTFKSKFRFIFDIFFLKEYDWVNLDNVLKLFPNLQEIELSGVNICEKSLCNLLSYLKKTQQLKLNEITIFPPKKKVGNAQRNLMKQYDTKFMQEKWHCEIESNELDPEFIVISRIYSS